MFIGDDLCLKKSFNDFTNSYFFYPGDYFVKFRKEMVLYRHTIFGGNIWTKPNRTWSWTTLVWQKLVDLRLDMLRLIGLD